MPKNNHQTCLCPLKGIIDLISKKWALLIINTLGNSGKLRFNQIMHALDGISPKTLSETLKELQAEGLVARESFAEIPPRVEYCLTNDGVDLRKSIIPLLEWTAKRSSVDQKRCESCPPSIRARNQANLGEKN
ncbi:MAG: helix-turn-helix transcriptional regulator [Candidatus Bathyarchaeota archaeon]|nr:helix-turn-helix transcriptional regulator [Candidatus Bathyarchaeota archaeon]